MFIVGVRKIGVSEGIKCTSDAVAGSYMFSHYVGWKNGYNKYIKSRPETTLYLRTRRRRRVLCEFMQNGG